MKKCTFYTLCGVNPHAIRRNGYTDGFFCYYKYARNLWYAIHPETGLGVASASTRKEAYAKAWAANFPMYRVTPEAIEHWKTLFQAEVDKVFAE